MAPPGLTPMQPPISVQPPIPVQAPARPPRNGKERLQQMARSTFDSTCKNEKKTVDNPFLPFIDIILQELRSWWRSAWRSLLVCPGHSKLSVKPASIDRFLNEFRRRPAVLALPTLPTLPILQPCCFHRQESSGSVICAACNKHLTAAHSESKKHKGYLMDINEACQKLPAPSSSKQLIEVCFSWCTRVNRVNRAMMAMIRKGVNF